MHPNVSASDITVLVRSVEKARKLGCFQFKTVVGSTEDRDLLKKLASKSHVVISCVSDLKPSAAMLS